MVMSRERRGVMGIQISSYKGVVIVANGTYFTGETFSRSINDARVYNTAAGANRAFRVWKSKLPQRSAKVPNQIALKFVILMLGPDATVVRLKD